MHGPKFVFGAGSKEAFFDVSHPRCRKICFQKRLTSRTAKERWFLGCLILFECNGSDDQQQQQRFGHLQHDYISIAAAASTSENGSDIPRSIHRCFSWPGVRTVEMKQTGNLHADTRIRFPQQYYAIGCCCCRWHENAP